MLSAIQTKILAAVLVAVTVIGTILVHEHNVNARAAAAAERTAALLQQQRDDADAAKKHDAELWKSVQEKRKKSNASQANSGKTWNNYLP